MSVRWRSTVAVLAGVATLGGCGSGAARHTATAPGTAGASSNHEASKAPDQILADAAAALARAHGYVMQGTIVQPHQRLTLKLTTTSPSSLQLSFSSASVHADLITLPGGSYVRANRAFWLAQADAAHAAALSDRWIEIPASAAGAVSSSLGGLAPGTVARCLVEDHGTLSVAGPTTVNGQAAIVLKDAGDVPGSSPSLLAVAASGPPYPLRATATGNQRAGGRIDVCNDGKASDARGSITFSQFGHVAPIQAPRGALATGASGPSV